MHGLQYVGDGMQGGEVRHALRSCMFAGFGEKNHRRSSVPSPDEEAPICPGPNFVQPDSTCRARVHGQV